VNASGSKYANELRTSQSGFFSSNTNFNLACTSMQADEVVHSLARASVFQSSSSIFHYPPTCIATIIHDEMMSYLSLKK